MKRKLLSVLLTFCLAFSLLPTAALAGVPGLLSCTLSTASPATSPASTVKPVLPFNTSVLPWVLLASLAVICSAAWPMSAVKPVGWVTV